ncbi:MAG TPA: sulfate ABC transporter substrate-binding protein [Actinomycetota bacterium]|nr:sulfate ABC transporter substrate-binding protein [Actinomycetota bacterium]
MPRWFKRRILAAPLVLSLIGLAACSSSSASGAAGCSSSSPAASPVVTLAAYSNPYLAYGKLISTWQSEWKDAHDGQLVQFLTSFGGSTTQAQSIINGLQADIYASSTAPDVQLVQDAGLITNDWQNALEGSTVQSGSVVFAVRPGNPKHIENWNDLTQPGLQILTPDPAQSGGARWNIVAAYGAAMRGEVPGYAKNNPADAQRLLEGIFKNVTVMDKSANDSLKNFEAGNGDVAITYDYQVATSQAAGGEEELVEPPSTVQIRTPTVVVDKNAEAHCVEDIANEFVKYLHSKEAQDIFASTAYTRPIDTAQAAKATDTLPAVKDLFTTDDIGGWDALVNDTVFGPNGAFTLAFQAAQG